MYYIIGVVLSTSFLARAVYTSDMPCIILLLEGKAVYNYACTTTNHTPFMQIFAMFPMVFRD